ncbi:MAG: hypothetical protein NTV70_08045 [Acidobacteria bacterium]|nr:hypothetical protein [Acidobacteriota bacterium]
METPTHYLWQPEGAQAPVKIAYDVVDAMLQDVMRGFGAVPKRGAEVGGILLGQVEAGVVVIDGFEQVACDHRLGPAWQFSDSEKGRVAAALAVPRPLKAVGIWRSHTDEGLSPRAQDQNLFDQHFPGAPQPPEAVLLIIQPFATRLSQAGFFHRRGGLLESVTPAEFAFARKQLGGGKRERRSRPSDAAEMPPDGAAPPSNSTAPQSSAGEVAGAGVTRIRASKGIVAAALTMAVVLGWSGGFFAGRALTHPPDPEHYALSLTVQPQPDGRRLSWNASSPVFRTATRGQLQIRTAGGDKTVPLDLDQLRAGWLLYSDATGSTRFSLEVRQMAGSVVMETVESEAGR